MSGEDHKNHHHASGGTPDPKKVQETLDAINKNEKVKEAARAAISPGLDAKHLAGEVGDFASGTFKNHKLVYAHGTEQKGGRAPL